MELIIRTVVATDNPDQGGDVIGADAIKSMCDQIRNKTIPISVSFAHRLNDSFVLGASIIGGEDGDTQLECVARVRINPAIMPLSDLYMVPGYTIDGESGAIRLQEISLTFNPSDPSLSPVQWTKRADNGTRNNQTTKQKRQA